MVQRLLFAAFTLLLFSCANETESGTVKTVPDIDKREELPVTDSACYIRAVGQDTFALKVYVNGDEVTGKLKYLYYQKDWRIGNLDGKVKGNIVTAKWTYMQEGMVDSTSVSFRLEDNKAYMQNEFYKNATGSEVMSNEGSYTEAYEKINCDNFPSQDFPVSL